MNLGATQFRNLWFSENGDGRWWMVMVMVMTMVMVMMGSHGGQSMVMVMVTIYSDLP
jgi:hypothetical protein